MNASEKVGTDHLARNAYLYVRQSSLHQVKDHRESTARQYDLKRRALALGWREEQIEVIDEDLGLSGASGAQRGGFQRLVAEVGLGRAGVVMGLEVSRFARNSADWHRLLEICALSDTLILDEDGLYDPSHFNDRLLLGLKGTMSEAELYVLRARLLGGALNKARRGELRVRLPIGYLFDAKGRIVFDPDTQIQQAVRLLFDSFRTRGSAEQVVRHFHAESIRFPRRLVRGPRAGEVIFVPLEHFRVLQILHNPRYTGTYVWGRTRQRKLPANGTVRYQRLPREEWKVFLPESYPGYISWQEYEANQQKLRDNAAGYGYDRKRSPPREGTALLQGMVICARCGKRMGVRYNIYKGRLVPRYTCLRDAIQKKEPPCQTILAACVDEAVSEAVLKAISPVTVELAFEVFEELRGRKAELARLQRAQVERVREEADLAQRQYMLVRPENRLVADSLERQGNEKMRALAQAEEEYARLSRQNTYTVSSQEKDRIQKLASDLPRVWNDPHTPSRERKRMLRLLIEDVTLLRSEVVRIQIRWRGGATSQIELPLPLRSAELRRTAPTVVELIRALASEQTDRQIASRLNSRWLRSGKAKAFTGRQVGNIRRIYGIECFADRLRRNGWLSVSEMAAKLHVHPQTAKQFAHQGILRAVCADDKGSILFEPTQGPLPEAHRGKRLRDRRLHPKLPMHVREEVQSDA